jgi:N-sulfoglucosamine sulfohydrolase
LPFPFASDLYGSATWQDTLQQKPTHYGQRSVHAYLQRPRWELYDLTRDPDEVQNLAENPAAAGVRQDLERRLQEFQRETRDPWIVKYRYE